MGKKCTKIFKENYGKKTYVSENQIYKVRQLYKGLQQMLRICQDYADQHNLLFRTNDNPKKSKTKCIKYQKTQIETTPVMLCDNNLPWVDSGKHLGNILENKIDGMQKDLKFKRARYISRNNNLIQEFHFAHPVTKFKINRIYNTDFTGSPLWDFNSEAFESLSKTWNISVRIMFGLPRTAHR